MSLSWLKSRLNFLTIHFIAFLLIPLFWTVVFWASNGKFHVKFVDSLFLCISAATGTGLITLDLSALTAWQQTILVILEIAGSPVTVSWLTVAFRRHYFLRHLADVVNSNAKREHDIDAPEKGIRPTDQSDKVTEVIKKLKSRSAPAIKRVESGVSQPNSSPDCTSDLQLTSGISETLGRQAAVPARPDHPQYKRPGLFSQVVGKLFPRLHRKLWHTVTEPSTSTLLPGGPESAPQSSHDSTTVVPYLTFPTIVGKNSAFRNLTREQLEELGGAEFRALNMLMWGVPLYYFFSLVMPFVVLTPYMLQPLWADVFLVPSQHRNISPVWFSLFQVVGAWTNTGMTLVDQNMIPFHTAYPMIALLICCVLAGGSGFPIFFRLSIWIYSKAVRKTSKTYETARFLLDHPRRCFIFMFPSRQTWLLLAILVTINIVDWIGFLIFNIGVPAVDSVPTGTRIFIGLLQAISVRNAGFQVVPLDVLAPALKVLYFVMMYIATFPVALSVRSTNVYEEQSLGIFRENEWQLRGDSRIAIWGNYILQHTSTQLSFDMWWLAVCIIAMCVIERTKLEDVTDILWFNVFSLTFETVSAYGNVGLSLGIPTQNYSFCGSLFAGSKIILCAVMIRGRHRGLPMAIDRAVMLPHEFDEKDGDSPDDADVPTEALPK